MKVLFIIAMDKEALKLADDYKLKKVNDGYYKNDNLELLITNPTRNGVTSKLSNYIYDYNIDIRNYICINVGMVGSNNLKIGDVYMVNNSYGYNFDMTMFDKKLYEAPYSPFKLNTLSNVKLCDCYTSDSFVLSTNIKSDALFDMELNSIVTFPFKKIYSIKLISDSLSNVEFENFNYDDIVPNIYNMIDEIIKENE